MSTITTTVDTLFEMWNEQDADRRVKLAAAVFADDGELVDPPFEGQGHDGISQMVAAVHQQFPGGRLRRTTGIDAHHDTLRYGWELVGADGSIVTTGLDVCQLAGDGRLRRVNGFLGPLPQEVSA